jgi:hypothetical protein
MFLEVEVAASYNIMVKTLGTTIAIMETVTFSLSTLHIGMPSTTS